MPRIDEPSKVKPFKKKQYRPWDMLDGQHATPENQNDNQPALNKDDNNLRQNKDNIETNVSQLSDKLGTFQGQTQDSSKTELSTIPKTNTDQTSDISKTMSQFTGLIGLQRRILLFLYDMCKLSRDCVTQPLAITFIAERCQSTRSSIQKSIQRLEHKGFIKRANFKIGRGGWTQYEIPDNLYQVLLQLETQDKLETILRQSADNSKTQTRTEPKTPASSSSSIDLITTTDLEAIQIDAFRSYGFEKTHIKQLLSKNLPVDVINQSLDYFLFDLEINHKKQQIRSSPVNFFMGIMLSQGIYNMPENYETPRERALRQAAALKRQQVERIKQQETNLIQLERESWLMGLFKHDLDSILPDEVKQSRLRGERDAYLNQYFLQEIWPLVKEEKYADLFMQRQE